MITEKKDLRLYLIVFLTLVFRFAYLDQDVPSWPIGVICPEDEAFYTVGAFNLYKNNTVHYALNTGKNLGWGLTEFIATPLTYLSFKTLGFNYWGLRIPVVLVSLLILFLSFKILEDSNKNNYLKFFLFCYLCTDFSLLVLSRFQTPTIYSTLILATACLLVKSFEKNTNEKKSFFYLFSLGVLGIIALAVTIYNLYIVCSIGVMLLCYMIWSKKFLLPALQFIAGIFTGVLFYYFFLLVADLSFTEILSGIFSFRGGKNALVDLGLGAKIIHYIKMNKDVLIGFLTTNIFRYNLSLLFFSVLLLPLFFINSIKNKNLFSLFLFLLIIIAYLQYIFEYSYPSRKLTPLLLVVLYILSNNDHWASVLSSFEKSVSYRKAVYILAFIAVCLCSFTFYYTNSDNFFFHYASTGLNDETPSVLFNALNIFVLILSVLLSVLFYTKKIKRNLLIVFSVLLLLPNTLLSLQQFFFNKTYHYRNAMIDMSKYVNNKVVSGDYPWAYQLYTTSLPIAGGYPFLIKTDSQTNSEEMLLNNGQVEYKIKYYLPYEKDFYTFKISDVYFSNSKYKLVVINKYHTYPANILLLQRQPL